MSTYSRFWHHNALRSSVPEAKQCVDKRLLTETFSRGQHADVDDHVDGSN